MSGDLIEYTEPSLDDILCKNGRGFYSLAEFLHRSSLAFSELQALATEIGQRAEWIETALQDDHRDRETLAKFLLNWHRDFLEHVKCAE